MSISEAEQHGTNKSLDELPLNIIFRILFFLDFDSLNKVSKTCRALKILSNESITYNRTLKEHTSANWWTKRLLFDLFHIMDRKRNLLTYISAERLSIIGSLRAVQENLSLGSGQQLIKSSGGCYEDFGAELGEFREDEEIDEDLLTTGDAELEENVEALAKGDIKRPIDSDGLAYIKILQGFHRIAINSHKLFRRPSVPQSADDVNEESPQEVETPTRVIKNVNVALTPIESFQSLIAQDDKSPECLQFNADSPDSSNRSRSASSVFSDPPKLTERAWSYGYELDHISDENNDSDSSSSTEFVRQLQNSNRVSDKKFLFERLMKKKREAEALITTRSNKSSTYDTIRPKIGPPQTQDARSLSQGYLMELERCDPPVTRAYHTAGIADDSSKEFLTRYQDHVAGKGDEKLELPQKKRETKKVPKTPHRRKLKAVVTDGNRICYEKI